MEGTIFLIQSNGELVEMKEQPYEKEDIFQSLIEKYPGLLAGDQIDSEAPRKWLLIKREMGVRAEAEGGERWSIDHLFIDQDGIPTFVEVKRSSDTRIRREVVGQMFEYAANATKYWPQGEIRNKFVSFCESAGNDPAQTLIETLNIDDHERFWENVETNLRSGKIRLLFVADQIPSELKRIVEFLNEQMTHTEVLAVEIKKYEYEGKEVKTLVSRVIGQTEEAITTKSGSRQTRKWDEKSFFEELKNTSPDLVEVVKEIYTWAKKEMKTISWGTGLQVGTFTTVIEHNDEKYNFITVGTNGHMSFNFGHIGNRSAFSEDKKRLVLLNKLNEIPEINLSENNSDHEKYPRILISLLKDEKKLKQFLNILDWAVNEVKEFKKS